jgi:hypothetical protein
VNRDSDRYATSPKRRLAGDHVLTGRSREAPPHDEITTAGGQLLFFIREKRMTLPGFEPGKWSVRHVRHSSGENHQPQLSDGKR